MKHAHGRATVAAALMLSTTISAVPVCAQEAPGPQAPAVKAAAKAAVAATPAAAEAAKKQKEAEAAKRAYDAGLKSYQAGKFEPAVQSLSAALRGGGLTSQDMARGLYYRGLAYKKQSKPGLAISDLTSALWLKNGLNDADRQSATAERSEAYKLAGLGDGNSGADAVAVADPNGQTSPAAAEPAAATIAASTAAPAKTSSAQPAKTVVASDNGLPTPFAQSEGSPPAIRTAPKSSAGAIDQLSALEQPRVVPTVAPAVPAPIPEQPSAQASSQVSKSTSSNSVSGFFTNLFGGGSETPATEQSPVTTSSTNQATSATSSWNDTTSVAAGAKPKAAPAVTAAAAAARTNPPVAAPQVQAVAAPPPQVKGGKYKIHIAAVRSRPEAEALAQKLVQQHGNQLAARAPTVDEAIIGSMGKFYRVRVGSFATAEEPRGLCNTLRNSGYDCLVVTN